MKIRTQFIIIMLLFGIILAVLGASAIITHLQIEKASQQEDLASNIAQGASELSYLSNDYLIYRESQQLKRWQSKFTSLSSQVASLNVDKPEQQVLVRNIKANEQRLKQVFDSLASAVGAPSAKRTTTLDLAFLQVSWSRMAVQSQGLVSDGSRLSQLLRQQMNQITETRTVLMYVMVGLFGALLLASYMLTYGRVLKSIARLQAGAVVIGSGYLDFKIEEKKNDEIGDLSHAFNQMTSSLKEVTASKADLEREITERKHAEEMLRRQREWLSVTLSSIGDAVIASDAEGRITFLNPVAVTVTGWKSEEALRQPVQSVFRIINEKTRAPAEDLLARVLNEKRVVALADDTALVTKDGREVAIEDSAAPIKDSTGNLIGVVLVFHDVTEKRRIQTALRESEERLRLAQTSAGAGTWDWDIPSGKLLWSEELFGIFGLDPGKASASFDSWRSVLHPEDRKIAEGKIEEAIKNRTPLESEYRIKLSSGEIRWIRALGNTVYDNNKPLRMSGICLDVTERKQAEEALAKMKDILSEGQKIAHLGTFEYLADTQTTVWSEEEYRIYGLPPAGPSPAYDVMLAKSIHPDDATLLHQVFTAAMQNRSVYELEHRIVRPDGSVRWVYDRAHPYFDQNGKLVRYVGATLDITERKRAEEDLRKALDRAVWLARFPEQNPNPVIRASADGTILYCNPVTSKLSGWRCEVGEVLQNELIPLVGRAMTEGNEVQEDVQLDGRTYVVWVAPFPGEGYANIYGRDITERKRAEEALRQRTLELQQLTETLNQQVKERTGELEVANEELRVEIDECVKADLALKESERNLRHLSMELLNAQEKERKAVAGEIHDSIGSSLAAIKFKVDNALLEIADKSPEATSTLKSLSPVIQGAIDEARRIQMNLRPSMLDDLGLLATIRWLCRQFESTYSDIHIRPNIKIEEHEVPDSLKTAIFRVLQEGLNNVAKHSKAKVVVVLLRKEDRAMRLTIQDYGQGFDVSKAQSAGGIDLGFGLKSMRERTELSGGDFSIQSEVGKGTTLRAEWPLSDEKN